MNIAQWIVALLETPLGNVSFTVLFFGGIAFAIWKLSAINASWQHSKSDIVSLKNNFNNMMGIMSEIKGKIASMSRDIDSIFARITKNDALSKTKSPLSLTEKGKKIAKELNIDGMLAEKWEDIVTLTASENKNANPYDIQKYLIEKFTHEDKRFISPQSINKLKVMAYNEGLSLYSFTRIVAIKARDKYFELKGINTKEVDTHDPQKNRFS